MNVLRRFVDPGKVTFSRSRRLVNIDIFDDSRHDEITLGDAQSFQKAFHRDPCLPDTASIILVRWYYRRWRTSDWNRPTRPPKTTATKACQTIDHHKNVQSSWKWKSEAGKGLVLRHLVRKRRRGLKMTSLRDVKHAKKNAKKNPDVCWVVKLQETCGKSRRGFVEQSVWIRTYKRRKKQTTKWRNSSILPRRIFIATPLV